VINLYVRNTNGKECSSRTKSLSPKSRRRISSVLGDPDLDKEPGTRYSMNNFFGLSRIVLLRV
jgi:hypothetical protein